MLARKYLSQINEGTFLLVTIIYNGTSSFSELKASPSSWDERGTIACIWGLKFHERGCVTPDYDAYCKNYAGEL
jgi:hypothetical protein